MRQLGTDCRTNEKNLVRKMTCCDERLIHIHVHGSRTTVSSRRIDRHHVLLTCWRHENLGNTCLISLCHAMKTQILHTWLIFICNDNDIYEGYIQTTKRNIPEGRKELLSAFGLTISLPVYIRVIWTSIDFCLWWSKIMS